MSLPSYAIFKDADGKVVAERFINCGWHWHDDMLGEMLLEIYLAKVGGGIPTATTWKTVHIYDSVLTVDEARDLFLTELKMRKITPPWVIDKKDVDEAVSDIISKVKNK